jgi:hypothetical protein
MSAHPLPQAAELALQLLLDGMLVGAVFALAAYGMALVWGVTKYRPRRVCDAGRLQRRALRR